MLRILYRIRFLFDAEETRRLLVLLSIVVGMALLEVVGLASILPFLQLAADPSVVESDVRLSWLYDALHFSSPRSMLAACGWAVIGLLAVSNSLGAFSVWQRQRLAWSIAHDVSMKLVHAYTKVPYDFFLQRNSASLIRKAIDDVNSLVNGVLLAGCQFISQLVISAAIFTLLVAVEPRVAICAFCLFAGVYVLIYFSRRKYLTRLGEERLAANLDRYRGFVELVTGIKAIRSDGASRYFVKRFEDSSLRFSIINPQVQFTALVPKYVIETLAFGGVIVLILVLVDKQRSFVEILPTLTLFALAGYRLMPAINAAYASIAQVLSSYPAVQAVIEDIRAADLTLPTSDEDVAFTRDICLDNLSFSYADSDHKVLDGVSLSICKGTKVAFVGPSGSGKTTLIDIVIGLLSPLEGRLLVDGEAICDANKRKWQDLIGYVPQEVFLYDASIERNVAFGSTSVDRARVAKACKIAQLGQFIEEDLAEGYETEIGERGVRLSGGQRQRLGLARAIYRHPLILVLDEATSALDSATEEAVVEAIHEQLPGVTIIMIAHRISTVRKCDQLFMIDRGRLIAQGNYAELLASSKLFRELARFT